MCENTNCKPTNEKTVLNFTWTPTPIENPDKISTGDMPGDSIFIGPDFTAKAQKVFPKILEMLVPILNNHPNQRAIISFFGGSGVGKTVIASVVSYYLNKMNIGSYVMSGDNYPRRIPEYNDAERYRIFRMHGLKALVECGEYTPERNSIIQKLQDQDDNDANPELIKEYPWLGIYQKGGRDQLALYLGTTNEIDFDQINNVISQFKNGANKIWLKRFGRKLKDVWYDAIDFSDKKVLVIEWTHGNNANLKGIDIPVLFNSTPAETLEQRRSRGRDCKTDSPFTTMILNIEQNLLFSQASTSKLIVAKNGDTISYEEFFKIMTK